MVKAKIQMGTGIKNKEKTKTSNTRQKAINTYKLRIAKIGNVYRENTEERFRQLNMKGTEETETEVEEMWQTFKITLLDITEETCVISTIDQKRKQTNWWVREIQEEVNNKKVK